MRPRFVGGLKQPPQPQITGYESQWKTIRTRLAGVHLYAGSRDAFVAVGGVHLYVTTSGQHWRPWAARGLVEDHDREEVSPAQACLVALAARPGNRYESCACAPVEWNARMRQLRELGAAVQHVGGVCG